MSINVANKKQGFIGQSLTQLLGNLESSIKRVWLLEKLHQDEEGVGVLESYCWLEDPRRRRLFALAS